VSVERSDSIFVCPIWEHASVIYRESFRVCAESVYILHG
jgi:hypothetical protein